MDLLLEFTLTRVPPSLQTKNVAEKHRYQRELYRAGTEVRRRRARDGEELFFSIGGFSWRGNRPDSDNIIKLAQDALMPVIRANDRQVRDSLGFTRAQLRGQNLVALGDLPALRRALAGNEQFLHIAISNATNPHFDGIVDA